MVPVEDNVPDREAVREAVMAVVREGEAEAIALIDGVEANVAERERLWLWLNVDDPDRERVAIEDMVMEMLEDMETEADEEADIDDETLDVEEDDGDVDDETLELDEDDTAVVGETLELEEVL
jgi:hypothetical protein